uniref:Gnk2-homologous domain-containing protein n=1 Tax=Oryza punctata TaxID=4537 RepID=A0A0E0KM62_ORYPU
MASARFCAIVVLVCFYVMIIVPPPPTAADGSAGRAEAPGGLQPEKQSLLFGPAKYICSDSACKDCLLKAVKSCFSIWSVTFTPFESAMCFVKHVFMDDPCFFSRH